MVLTYYTVFYTIAQLLQLNNHKHTISEIKYIFLYRQFFKYQAGNMEPVKVDGVNKKMELIKLLQRQDFHCSTYSTLQYYNTCSSFHNGVLKKKKKRKDSSTINPHTPTHTHTPPAAPPPPPNLSPPIVDLHINQSICLWQGQLIPTKVPKSPDAKPLWCGKQREEPEGGGWGLVEWVPEGNTGACSFRARQSAARGRAKLNQDSHSLFSSAGQKL